MKTLKCAGYPNVLINHVHSISTALVISIFLEEIHLSILKTVKMPFLIELIEFYCPSHTFSEEEKIGKIVIEFFRSTIDTVPTAHTCSCILELKFLVF